MDAADKMRSDKELHSKGALGSSIELYNGEDNGGIKYSDSDHPLLGTRASDADNFRLRAPASLLSIEPDATMTSQGGVYSPLASPTSEGPNTGTIGPHTLSAVMNEGGASLINRNIWASATMGINDELPHVTGREQMPDSTLIPSQAGVLSDTMEGESLSVTERGGNIERPSLESPGGAQVSQHSPQ